LGGVDPLCAKAGAAIAAAPTSNVDASRCLRNIFDMVKVPNVGGAVFAATFPIQPATG
jgi:hypothetical protein